MSAKRLWPARTTPLPSAKSAGAALPAEIASAIEYLPDTVGAGHWGWTEVLLALPGGTVRIGTKTLRQLYEPSLFGTEYELKPEYMALKKIRRKQKTSCMHCADSRPCDQLSCKNYVPRIRYEEGYFHMDDRSFVCESCRYEWPISKLVPDSIPLCCEHCNE